MWEIPTPAIFKMQDINAPAKSFVCRQMYTHMTEQSSLPRSEST